MVRSDLLKGPVALFLKEFVLLLGLFSTSTLGAYAQGQAQGDALTEKQSSEKPMPQAKDVAVPNGTLMIVGGGITTLLRRHFVKLAGGKEAQIVCVPTALPHGRISGWCRRFFREAGVPKENRKVLHTRKPEIADRASFIKPLETAEAVWFTGGRQWRLVEAYAGTQTLEAFHDVLERGGVIGGTSAGASIQGSFLIRGDPKSKKIVVGKYTEGFGFLSNSAIDQHLRARGREEDLVDVIGDHPNLLGIGIDEGTAAVVQHDTLQVVGDGLVAIYDAKRLEQTRQPEAQPQGQKRETKPGDKGYYFIEPGDRFNLQTRNILSAPAAGPKRSGQ